MIVLLGPDLNVSKKSPAIERKGLGMRLILKEVNLDWKRALDLIEDSCIPSFRHRPSVDDPHPRGRSMIDNLCNRYPGVHLNYVKCARFAFQRSRMESIVSHCYFSKLGKIAGGILNKEYCCQFLRQFALKNTKVPKLNPAAAQNLSKTACMQWKWIILKSKITSSFRK